MPNTIPYGYMRPDEPTPPRARTVIPDEPATLADFGFTGGHAEQGSYGFGTVRVEWWPNRLVVTVQGKVVHDSHTQIDPAKIRFTPRGHLQPTVEYVE